MTRRDEIAAGLASVEQRIVDACTEAGRDRSEITLIVVTKTYPASDVELVAELGVLDVGENRHPEAGDKAEQVAAPLRWHFLGGLQTNKAGAIARYADTVHSVDRVKLVNALSRGAEAAGRTLRCLVQIDFGEADGRSGVAPAGLAELAAAVADADHLELAGIMTVAPLGEDPVPHFQHLVRLSADLRKEHPEATIISAGMSDDFQHAIKAGATHLRLGRSVLGERASTR
ncbi:pyridoxal phosphate enzyme (YggS family) [Aeromicrobium panaciterrae]|uniref:Pyridoxal phosphate homeostasis protein n=1 Tax=Aeromicrobium panaciterrae TaxID=363861 RepID=A0ABU1UPN7_9ACTN|nr:YggS family pyridoxal phosphate-dependent enzyme [Aeromicrobium panaciterrae]MDR7087150.1 pyridoxal phosphate enzyme (YggS family) [Aeromicrobium panaciterrae]